MHHPSGPTAYNLEKEKPFKCVANQGRFYAINIAKTLSVHEEFSCLTKPHTFMYPKQPLYEDIVQFNN